MFRWLLALLFIATAQAQLPSFKLPGSLGDGQPDTKNLVRAHLVADTTAITPGKPFEVGLVLEMAPKWHTYWEYGGDAGLPTSIKWTLPPGFTAGGIQWPLPERDVEPGGIEVYAYGGQTMLITTITPPADFKETSVTLQATASWLVCAEICIPGKAEVDLTLPVGGDAQPANAELFAKFRTQLPSSAPPPYQLDWKRTGEVLQLTVSGLGDAKAIDVFPLPADGQIVEHPKPSPVAGGSATVEIKTEGDLRGVLVVETAEGRKGWVVSSTEAVSAPARASVPSAASSAPVASLWHFLLLGFLGGLILNLMPCVLPVISLKIFGFIRQAGEHPEKILRHGLAFVAGIFVWFLGLAAFLVALRSSGSEATWAAQFQNPAFILAIACVVFVFALNLFGVFEIILPGRVTNALAEASSGGGYAGSFFQGVFATLLATPCTAPFLGPALGFALAKPSGVIFLMFGAIALGMSAPYFLLSAKPGWMKILPKPGLWMERVKQFMGFPLIATLIWLLYVYGNQRGFDAVVDAAGFLLCLALACWIYGAFCGPLSRVRTRAISLALIVVVIAGGWRLFFVKSADHIDWQPFSQASLNALLKEGKPVFVDFTADWCISCKFNERTAIDVPAVRAAFAKDGIVPMKADWTNSDPEITAALARFGRVGVPFYVIYPAGKPDAPIALPEILTKDIVLDALAKARR